MKHYSIHDERRIRLFFYLSAASLSLGSLIGYFSSALFNGLLSTPSSFAIFGMLYLLYDRYLWKTTLFSKIAFIPCFDGRWDGDILITKGEDKGKRIKVQVMISQTWSKIDVLFKSDTTRSNCRNVSIDFQNPNNLTLLWIYNMRPNALNEDPKFGEGVTELHASTQTKIKTLDGSYYSTKFRCGSINLVRKNG